MRGLGTRKTHKLLSTRFSPTASGGGSEPRPQGRNRVTRGPLGHNWVTATPIGSGWRNRHWPSQCPLPYANSRVRRLGLKVR